MSASFASEGSGPGGHDLWDPMPVAPPTPPAKPKPDEFVWSKPERLREPPGAEEPKGRAKGGGRPVKKSARTSAKRAKGKGGNRKRR